MRSLKTPEAAGTVAEALNFTRYVVKAQIHAGGRGKGGGIKLANSPAEVKQHAETPHRYATGDTADGP